MSDSWLKINHSLIKRLFPQTCIFCESSNTQDISVCNACLGDLPFHKMAHCPQCALPCESNLICGHCITSPPDFDKTIAIFRYEYPISQLIQHYKYAHQLNLSGLFSGLLLDKITNLTKPDLIIPMPLHPKRLSERGFNQSLEIAKLISNALATPVNYQACIRNQYAPPQASLPLKQRARNMQGAFECNQSLDGLRVALIDDVMTTGASMNALAKAIKAKGASHVECWVIARTLLK